MKLCKSLLTPPILAISAVIFLAFGAQGTNYTWTGAGTPNEDGSLNWSDSANWNATAPAYPGMTAKGAASTSDQVTFPESATARVRFDVATTIYHLTAKAANIDLTFDSPAGNALTLTGSLILGDSNSTGTSGSRVTLDGARIIAANSTTLQSGAALVLKNAADLKVTSLYVYSSGDYQEGLVDLSGRSVLTMSQLDIGGGGKLVIDDSTVTNTARVYLNEGYQGGGRIVFKGVHSLWVVKGDLFRSDNATARVNGTDFDFLVPEGGYAEPPLQYVHATSMFLNGASKVTVPMRLNLLPDSPAIAAGDPLDQTLVTTVAGIYTAGLALNGAQHAGSITVEFNDVATAVVSHISSPAKTLDVESVNAFASGANIANVHREDLSEGDEIVLRAGPVVTKRGTATPTGVRVFDVDPDTLARTEIEGSPFAGSEVTYVHGTTRCAVVWQWSWVGEGDIFVSPSVGSDANGGTSWNDAYATVTKAFEGLAAGKTVVLDAGEHPIAAPLSLTVGATVRGMGMYETEIVPSDPANSDTRGMMMNNADALIEDLAFSGFVRRVGSYDYYGLGLYIDKDGGTARNCRFTKNSGRRLRAHGQGVYMLAGSLFNCLIDHNVATSDGGGGGLYMNGKTAYAENCLIVGNAASVSSGGYYGGGVWLQSGTLVNCTITGNTSKNGLGGGVWVGTDENNPARMYNCIVWGNSAPNDAGSHAPDIKINGDGDPSKYLFNCISKSGAGTDGLADDPEFTDAANGDYTLRPNSPAIDSGSDERKACISAVDFVGNPRRVGTIDIGCYEVDTSVLACGFAASGTEAFIGDSVTLTATVRGGQGDLAYDWAALESDGVELVGDGAEATATFTKAGWYGFRLTVTDSAAAAPASVTRERYVYIAPKSVTLALGADLQTAIDAAIDGQEIVLEDGTHTVPTEVTLDKAVRIVGSGYDSCTLQLDPGITGAEYDAKLVRVLYINHSDAVVAGVTITGGKLGYARSLFGCGVWIGANGGTVTNCCITGNKACARYQYGGGVGLTGDKALLTHCIVRNNSDSYGGGTSYGGGVALCAGTVDTCLILDNAVLGVGGGVAFIAGSGVNWGKAPVVRNSTFSRNSATQYGGGIWISSGASMAKAENCLFAGNSAPNDSLLGAPEWSPEYNATPKTQAANYKTATNAVSTCAFYAASPLGEGSVAVDQPFENPNEGNFHLLAGNGAVDAGTWYEGIADDLDGKPRDETPDIGCYELDKSKFTCSFAISPEAAFNDQPVAFTPTVQNSPENLTYTWTLTDRFGVQTVLTEVAPTQAIAKCGWYGVKLRVEEIGKPSNAAEFEVGEALHIAPHDVYAVGGGVNPTMAYPFDSEEKGHTNLLELAEEMIDGMRVHLGEGEFVVNAEFAVTVGATVTGAGMDKTVIRYVRPSNTSVSRVLRLNHPQCAVEKLTVTGGYFDGSNNNYYNLWGSGAYIDSKGGTLQDCRITGNRSSTYHTIGGLGVKSTAGYVHRCIIDNNRQTVGTAYGSGIGLADGYIDNCLVVSNTAYEGAGVYMSGSNYAELRNCVITENFIVNSSSVTPGGLYMNGCGDAVKVSNCIFFRNEAGTAASKVNCSGYPEFHMYWNNGSHALDSTRAKMSLLNCLMDVDLEALGATSLGTDGVTGDPKFVDAAAWNFRLDHESPCVNAGNNRDYTAESVDFYGEKRIFNFGKRSGKVDIGCSESPWGTPGFGIIVR